MEYLKAFLIGGLLCTIAQLIIDLTKLTPARILVIYVTVGVILGSLGIYEKMVDFAGTGATIPLSGFGYALSKGTFSEIDKNGFIGVFTGGIKASAGGIAAAVIFGYIMSLLATPKTKK